MKRVSRPLWLCGGVLSFGLGTIGIALPIMPTVPFYLLAAWCFSKSHPEWADRLHAHPHYGPPLLAWRDRRAVSRKAKISAIAAMTASVPFTWFTVGWPWVLIPAGVLLVVGPWMWTRPE